MQLSELIPGGYLGKMLGNFPEGILGVEGGIVEMMEVPRHNKNLSNVEVLRAMPAPKVMKIFQDGLKSSKEVEIME